MSVTWNGRPCEYLGRAKTETYVRLGGYVRIREKGSETVRVVHGSRVLVSA